jgi:hypothetical protein
LNVIRRAAPEGSPVGLEPEPGFFVAFSLPGISEDFGMDDSVPIRIPVTDVFDLHSVPPRDVKPVVEEYLAEAVRLGITALRIIHGRGIGVQREIVRSIISRHPNVIDYRDAPLEAGGRGATVVTLAQQLNPPRHPDAY